MTEVAWVTAWGRSDGARRVGEAFREVFGGAPDGVCSAPGRVNVIGEHTDYNAGQCLPIALPHRTYVALRSRLDDVVRVASAQEAGRWETDLADVAPGVVHGWGSFVAGVAATAQWLTTVYLLIMAIVIPTSGFLIQRFSTRQVYLAAMSLFTTGTLVAALAPGFGVLLTGRVLQAGGAAVMMPLLMTAVLHTVPAGRRGRTMGTVSIVTAAAPALGPGISGAVLAVLDWHFLFWIVAPIALGVVIVGAARLPKSAVEPRDLQHGVVEQLVTVHRDRARRAVEFLAPVRSRGAEASASLRMGQCVAYCIREALGSITVAGNGDATGHWRTLFRGADEAKIRYATNTVRR